MVKTAAMAMGIESFAFAAMASRCEIRLAAPHGEQAEHLAQRAMDEVWRIERKYSRYQSDSIVSRINAAAGQSSVQCDAETLGLLTYADTLYASSGGLFDISSGVLRRAWDFRHAAAPSVHVLQALLPLVGWQQVAWQHGQVRLAQAGMEIDFGGFGKEYAADRAAALLAELGVQHGVVNLGGDLRIIGAQPNGQAWHIGVQDPRNAEATVASIPMYSGALTTSGDYERFIEVDGQRYCHILHPRTGMPVSHWRSVSVLGPLALAAGSCATIAMLLEHDGLAFLEQSGMGYLAIDQAGQCFRKNVEQNRCVRSAVNMP